MSTRSTVWHGRFGHVFWEQGECAYFWRLPGTRRAIWLPGRWLWHALESWQGRS